MAVSNDPDSLDAASAPDTATAAPLIQMAPGHFQTIYLTGAGAVYTLGSDNRGQLGNGTFGRTSYSSIPVHVGFTEPMKQVGSGMGTCWSVSADGLHAYAWGDNSRGQLGIGNASVRYSTKPMPIDFHLPPGVTISSMADGLKAELALLSNGQVLAWGDNRFGQCGLNPKTAGNFIYKPTAIPGLGNVASLTAGDYYSMALQKDGTVLAWGQNTNGEIGPQGPAPEKHSHTFVPTRVTGLPQIKTLVAGGKNAIAVDQGGNVWEWGRNKFGELGNGTIDPHDGAHPSPHMVSGLPPIASIDSEGPTVVAADAGGNIYTWGFDKWGAVGDGHTTNTDVPQHVLSIPISPDAGEPSVQVAAAHRSIYAYNVVTGQTYAWGENNYGQIGIPANHVPNPHPIDISAVIEPTLEAPLCFAAGTLIRTGAGETPIELLAVGDLVATISGALCPIRWIGHRRFDCRRHPVANRVWPIRIEAGAFGDHLPARDLLVSPGHGILVRHASGDCLVPAGHLVNDDTITQEPVAEVDYFHIELDLHDIVFAESLPVESYLDAGDRAEFENSEGVLVLHPVFAALAHEAACLPFVVAGPVLEEVRSELAARAGRAGHQPRRESVARVDASRFRVKAPLRSSL